MQELKPEGWWHAYYPPNNPQKYWMFRNTSSPLKSGTGEIVPLYALPATHRIVSVELLKDILPEIETFETACAIRAIIDKEPT